MGEFPTWSTRVEEIGDVEWRVTSSAHLNHQDYASSEVATQLWMDQHLKKKFSWPVMPKTELTLKADGGISHFSVRPDTSRKILEVDVYYTQQGQEGKGDHHNHIHQFWHHAVCEKISVTDWRAKLPVFTTEKPLWVYANVLYELDEPVAGAGYYYREYSTDTFNLSSLVEIVTTGAIGECWSEAYPFAQSCDRRFHGGLEKGLVQLSPGRMDDPHEQDLPSDVEGT